MKLNVVLLEPEIPHNTGNIVRTCAATGIELHLIKPLGFSIEDKYLKRVGLDYWDLIDIKIYEDYKQFIQCNPKGNFFYATTKGGNVYSEFEYREECFIIFGKETAGLPEELLVNNKSKCIRIPMVDNARSLNLSNSVAIVIYEALRQNNFEGLKKDGKRN